MSNPQSVAAMRPNHSARVWAPLSTRESWEPGVGGPVFGLTVLRSSAAEAFAAHQGGAGRAVRRRRSGYPDGPVRPPGPTGRLHDALYRRPRLPGNPPVRPAGRRPRAPLARPPPPPRPPNQPAPPPPPGPAPPRLAALLLAFKRQPPSAQALNDLEEDLLVLTRHLGRGALEHLLNCIEPDDKDRLPAEIKVAGIRYRR